MIEEMIEIILYARKVLDNQGWFWSRNDQLKGPIAIKQSSKKILHVFMPKRHGEVQGSVFSFLVVDEGLQSSLTMTSLVLLASKPSDRTSKEFGNQQPNRISGLRTGLKAIRVSKQEKPSLKHITNNQSIVTTA
jgi:hypothetical protein